MGAFSGDHNGCSWIASFNALLVLDDYQTPADIVDYYEQSVDFMGGFGVSPKAVAGYFESIGYNATVEDLFFAKSPVEVLDANLQGNGVAILEYWTGSGTLHYVAIEYSGGQFVAYNQYSNGTEGKYHSSATEFFSSNRKAHAIITIS